MVTLLIITLAGAIVWLTTENDKLGRRITALEVSSASLDACLNNLGAAVSSEISTRALADDALARRIYEVQEK